MSTRIAQTECATVLQSFPMMGSTALFMDHCKGDVEYAATNGKIVYLGDKFFPLDRKMKQGILLHEYTHACLSHPQRAAVLKIKEGKAYDGRILNIAADSIINDGIAAEARRKPVIALPEGAIYLSKMLEDLLKIGAISSKDEVSSSKNSIEQIYFLLKDAQKRANDLVAAPENKIDDNATETQKNEQQQQKEARKAANRLLETLKDPQDLIEAPGTMDQLLQDIRKQTERLKNAQTYGKHGSNILEHFKGDIPQSTTPWEQHFRTLTARYLAKKRTKNRSRPSGAMISHDAMGNRGLWEPGRKRPPMPKALVIGDSSGSIDLGDFGKMLGEVKSMKRRTNAHVDFGTADTALHYVKPIDEAGDISSMKFEGRGGTNFIDALSYAEKHRYDVVIYLTDLCGTFPASCKVPVIWGVIGDHRNLTAPFGRVIRI